MSRRENASYPNREKYFPLILQDNMLHLDLHLDLAKGYELRICRFLYLPLGLYQISLYIYRQISD